MRKIKYGIIAACVLLWLYCPTFKENTKQAVESYCDLTDYAISESREYVAEFMDSEIGDKNYFEVKE